MRFIATASGQSANVSGVFFFGPRRGMEGMSKHLAMPLQPTNASWRQFLFLTVSGMLFD
jgi:hypothetical protein